MLVPPCGPAAAASAVPEAPLVNKLTGVPSYTLCCCSTGAVTFDVCQSFDNERVCDQIGDSWYTMHLLIRQNYMHTSGCIPACCRRRRPLPTGPEAYSMLRLPVKFSLIGATSMENDAANAPVAVRPATGVCKNTNLAGGETPDADELAK